MCLRCFEHWMRGLLESHSKLIELLKRSQNLSNIFLVCFYGNYSTHSSMVCLVFIRLTSLLPLTVTDRHSSWLPEYRYLADIPRWCINTLCQGKDCVFVLQNFFFFLSANVFHTDTMRWQFKMKFFLNEFWGTPCTRSLGYPLMWARVRRRENSSGKKQLEKKKKSWLTVLAIVF